MRAQDTVHSGPGIWLLGFCLALGSFAGGKPIHGEIFADYVQRNTADIAPELDPMEERTLELAIVRFLVLSHVPVGTCPPLCLNLR